VSVYYKPGIIDCQHTLRLLRDVGYWQILIRVTESCEANFVKVRGGTVTDRLTGPPIVAHVSVNQSEIIVTVSCRYTIANTSRTSPEGQEHPM
jgi:anti-sigma-K factor RskA